MRVILCLHLHYGKARILIQLSGHLYLYRLLGAPSELALRAQMGTGPIAAIAQGELTAFYE